eukprot:sb/3471888/
MYNHSSRWASPRKNLTKLGHETSYLDYSIPSFKVPWVFGALAPWELQKHTSQGARAPKTPGTLNEDQEPTETSKQPIRPRYLGHVTGYQPIRDQYFLIRSSDPDLVPPDLVAPRFTGRINFPRYRKLTVFHPDIPGKTLSPEDPVKSGSDCIIIILYGRQLNRPKQVNNQSELVI